LFVAPIRARVTEGAARLHTTHALLNTRCTVRTDDVLEARALLQSRQVTEELWRLCCSSEAFLSIANGRLEFSEEQLPTPDTAGWIRRHLRSLRLIAAAAQGTAVPSEEVVVSGWAHKPVWVAVASTVLVVVGLITLVNVKSARGSRRHLFPTSRLRWRRRFPMQAPGGWRNRPISILMPLIGRDNNTLKR